MLFRGMGVLRICKMLTLNAKYIAMVIGQWSHYHSFSYIILSIQKIKIRYYILSSNYQAVSCKLIFTIHLTIVVWALASAGPVLARLTLTLTQAELTGVLSPGLAPPHNSSHQASQALADCQPHN